jgi:hypothetical protein
MPATTCLHNTIEISKHCEEVSATLNFIADVVEQADSNTNQSHMEISWS